MHIIRYDTGDFKRSSWCTLTPEEEKCVYAYMFIVYTTLKIIILIEVKVVPSNSPRALCARFVIPRPRPPPEKKKRCDRENSQSTIRCSFYGSCRFRVFFFRRPSRERNVHRMPSQQCNTLQNDLVSSRPSFPYVQTDRPTFVFPRSFRSVPFFLHAHNG